MAEEYLKLKKSNCKNCYKCIRHCPVKSIRFSDDQAHIIPEECILCGHCFVACPQNAKEIRNDVAKAKELIKSGQPVYASIAPSFVANYDNVTIKSMEEALKKLGFSGVEETAIGATIVKKQYENMVKDAQQDVIISTCCHTVNLLVQKHFPKAIPYLAKVVSPMQAHCLDIRMRHPEAKTVFIGPCIAKKEEAERYADIVDCALTFEELSDWLYDEKIQLNYIEDDSTEGRARFFPTSGGILKTMDLDELKDYTFLTVDGIENCINAIEDILNGNIHKCFIEMSACAGSCIGGPAMDKNHRMPIRDYVAISKYAEKDDFNVASISEKIIKKEFETLEERRIMVSDSAIEEVLREMGKTKPEDELNCGSCGYNTCREKAMAVLQGKATITMCLPYLKEKAESFSDNIIQNTPNAVIVLNENLEVQQINQAACRLINNASQRDVLGNPVVRILDPTPFINAYQQGQNFYDKRVYLAEYQKYVEQSVIYDKEYHIIICIMRDITDETKQREHKQELSRTTVEITDKVIEKQMRAVQEIASLLGESTAETKVALTKLKESLSDE